MARPPPHRELQPDEPEFFPDSLRAAAIELKLTAGEALFRIGDPVRFVYRVQQGEMRLVRYGSTGVEASVQVAGPGDFFAEASLMANHYHCDGECHTDSLLLAYPAPAFRHSLANDNTFALRWMSLLCASLRDTRARLECLHLKTPRERILHSLALSANAEGVTQLRQPLIRWARELGLSHETLYRALAALDRSGTIDRTGRSIRLIGR